MIQKVWDQNNMPNASLEDLFFKLRDIEMVSVQTIWQTDQQLSDSYVIIVGKSGQGKLRIGHLEYQLFQNETIYICPPNETFGVSVQPSCGLELVLLRFDILRESKSTKKALYGEKDMQQTYLHREIHLESSVQVVSKCQTIFNHWRNSDQLERFRGQLVFHEIIYKAIKYSMIPPHQQRTNLDFAKEYLESHFDENITIEQLAQIAEISPKYFVDLFKKTYGITAIDYLTELRIKKAKQLMDSSSAKLRDIAHLVGYNDEFYFSRTFKKKVGVSPTIYLKKRRQKLAAYQSSNIGQLLALNIVPYAAPLHPKWTPFYYDKFREDICVHLSAFRQNQDWESNIETLLHAKPDIVISTDQITETERERLEKVASVFYVPTNRKDWREQLLLTAEFLGEMDEAERFLRNYDQRVKLASNQVKMTVKDERVLVVRIFKQHMYLQNNRGIIEVLYDDLQLAPAITNDQIAQYKPLSIEQLMELNADHLLLLVCKEPETLTYWKKLSHSTTWKELKAVRGGKVRVLPSDPWFEYSPVAHDRMVSAAVRLFSGDCPF